MKLSPWITGVVFEHARSVDEDLSHFRTNASFASQIVVTQLSTQAVGTQTSVIRIGNTEAGCHGRKGGNHFLSEVKHVVFDEITELG